MRMPEVLANATEAVLSKWLVEEGSAFVIGQPLADVETEKALVEVAAESDGILGRYITQPGATVLVGAPIAILLTPGETQADINSLLASEGGAVLPEVVVPQSQLVEMKEVEKNKVVENKEVSNVPESVHINNVDSHGRIFASPLARLFARENSVDPSDISGTGPGGRIVKRDVENFLALGKSSKKTAVAASALASNAPSGYTAIKHTPMRKAIARRLTESKSTVPHFYLSAPCIADDLLNMRKKINEWSEKKVSVTDLILKTVAATFIDVPEANVIWTDDEMWKFSDVDISIAVATEKGLVTPVVRAVNQLSLSQLSERTEDLIARARSGKLKQNEIEGGSFSVTNLGMYGTDEFFAILNPPQSAILAVGGASLKPVVINGAITIASIINFTLSVDHRAIDGALAAQWLAAFVKRFENPMWLVV